jgi:hypothetical protein
MKSTSNSVRFLFTILVALLAAAGTSRAALSLTVSEFTSTHITVTVSGTLDADTSGLINAGTFFVAPSSNLTTPWYSGSLSIVLDTMNVGGTDAAGPAGDNNGTNTGFSLYWGQAVPTGFGTPGNIVTAGTEVSGTVRASGTIDNVNFYATDFKLYSGQPSPRVGGRLEASVVPEPASALLFGMSTLGLIVRRRG